jgi:hypothetical protein
MISYLMERSFKEREDSLVGFSHCDQRDSSFVALGDLVLDIMTLYYVSDSRWISNDNDNDN